MDVTQLMESRFKAYQEEGTRRRSDWAPLIAKVNEGRAKEGKALLSEHDENNLAICFENASMDTMARGRGMSLLETTDSSANSFVNMQLPIIASIIPNQVLSEIATVNLA